MTAIPQMAMPQVPAAILQIDARGYLIKVLRMRGKLIAEKKGRWNDGALISAYSIVKRWFEFYNPTNAQCAAYIRKNQDTIAMIIPGKGCAAHQSLMQTYNQITA